MREDTEALLQQYRNSAERLGFPPFLGEERDSTPLNASPYVAHVDDLREGRFLSTRGPFLREFTAALDAFGRFAVRPVAALLGGSAIGPKPDPGDLDCVVFYEAAGSGPPQVPALREFLARCKLRGVDMRALPIDGDPLLMLKSVAFFSMLFSKNAGDLTIVRGLVLVDCRDRLAP
jgi:hypothetical protein